METVTRFADRQAGSVSAVSTPGPEVARTLSVTATYLLSEDGRKASLLAGGDGHAVQQIALQVPANRLHLVSVDKQGVARLKLRPRFERDGERGLVRIDAAPAATTRRRQSTNSIGPLRRITNWRAPTMPSASPSARNGVTMTAPAARASRKRSLRTRANAPSRIRRRRPSGATSSPTRGRLLFDVATDQGLAKEVPPEAHRRFRADLRAKEERDRQDRAAQLALHEEKKRFIADWVAANGTDEQKARQARRRAADGRSD